MKYVQNLKKENKTKSIVEIHRWIFFLQNDQKQNASDFESVSSHIMSTMCSSTH